jgi:hypothetical protein
MEQDYRRGVTETFLNALSRGFNLDGEVRSFWIQDSEVMDFSKSSRS